MDRLTFTVCPQGEAETRVILEAFLEALTQTNEVYFRRFPGGPCCPKCAGILYDPPGARARAEPGQDFASVERIVVLQRAACGDVAAMVAARKRVLEGATARVKLIPQNITANARDYHAVVELEGGELYDPTKDLDRLPGCACEG